MKINDKNYTDVIKTAFAMLPQRTLTDIPYSADIFNEVEKLFPDNYSPENVKANIKKAVTFEARYKLIDKMLAASGITQVLELAAGFSQRGLIFSENKDSRYIELDLPEMADMKRQILNKIGKVPGNLDIIGGNALRNDDFIKAAKLFNPNENVAVVNEGLLRYLDFDEKAQVANNIKTLLKKFGGLWITCDITMKKFLENQSNNVPGYDKKLAEISKKNFESNAFSNESHAKNFFEDMGFDVEFYPFVEIQGELVSPINAGISNNEVRNLLDNAVVAVFRYAK